MDDAAPHAAQANVDRMPLDRGDIAVVIPALNEALRIRGVVEGALAQCPRVIVVDDGSDDDTVAKLDGLPVTLLRHAERHGKGASLRDGFRAYWTANGGLAVFGFPISEPFEERNADDGQVYTVQYFERNRLEYHPELAGTPYEILLGQLGRQALRRS